MDLITISIFSFHKISKFLNWTIKFSWTNFFYEISLYGSENFQLCLNNISYVSFRFVRLGVPPIELDAQGRARPSICELYRWRYKNLQNLPHVLNMPEYQTSNAGFCFDYQLINVEDFNGIGESEPNPYFYQVILLSRCLSLSL